MSENTVFVAITRPGKKTVHVEIPKGETVEYALTKAELSSSDYNSWSFTDDEGNDLTLSSTLDRTTQIIAGPKVDGAH